MFHPDKRRPRHPRTQCPDILDPSFEALFPQRKCESFHQEDPVKRAKWPVKFDLKSAHTVVM